mmetsp:Transcript_76255/g.220208  ORF Transcript_76255/g.220208 Transcript_76255/m.220208 type:complete len:357 (+) Transcript_76255:511-1581(+)
MSSASSSSRHASRISETRRPSCRTGPARRTARESKVSATLWRKRIRRRRAKRLVKVISASPGRTVLAAEAVLWGQWGAPGRSRRVEPLRLGRRPLGGCTAPGRSSVMISARRTGCTKVWTALWLRMACLHPDLPAALTPPISGGLPVVRSLCDLRHSAPRKAPARRCRRAASSRTGSPALGLPAAAHRGRPSAAMCRRRWVTPSMLHGVESHMLQAHMPPALTHLSPPQKSPSPSLAQSASDRGRAHGGALGCEAGFAGASARGKVPAQFPTGLPTSAGQRSCHENARKSARRLAELTEASLGAAPESEQRVFPLPREFCPLGGRLQGSGHFGPVRIRLRPCGRCSCRTASNAGAP